MMIMASPFRKLTVRFADPGDIADDGDAQVYGGREYYDDETPFVTDADQRALDWCLDCTQAGGHCFREFEENTYRCIHCGVER